MRPGLRAQIFLAALVPAVIALVLAHASALTWVGSVGVALGCAWLLSSAVMNHVGEVEAAATRSIQQLAEKAARLSTDGARIEAILSGMVEGVLVIDSSGRLRLVNKAARLMLNLDDTTIGRPYVESLRHPAIVKQLGAGLKGEPTSPVEVPIANRIFSAQATAAGEGTGGAVLVLHDITELRRADRVRRDFVANVSHELRTPLTAVRGYVEALMEEQVPEVQRRFLEVIERQAGRMERLVRDLLRLARLDAQQETAELARCEVDPLLRSVVADLSAASERRNVRFDIKVDPDASVVQVDPTKLHDALRNLIENAVHYSPEGGCVELAVRIDQGRAVLTVGDRGPGLPDSDVGRVFERFYRVDKSRSRDPGGTGLGLSIVKHLVELHGGQVRAENRAEGGALFTIVLPQNASSMLQTQSRSR